MLKKICVITENKEVLNISFVLTRKRGEYLLLNKSDLKLCLISCCTRISLDKSDDEFLCFNFPDFESTTCTDSLTFIRCGHSFISSFSKYRLYQKIWVSHLIFYILPFSFSVVVFRLQLCSISICL